MDRIFEMLANLRSKSDAVKLRTALFGSGILTILIFIGWLFYFNASVAKNETAIGDESIGPFAALESGLSSSWQSIKDKFDLGGAVVYQNPVWDSTEEKTASEAGSSFASSSPADQANFFYPTTENEGN